MKKHILLFLLILFLGGFLRLYQLASVPAHPFIDEISNGYNAYSILKTGADEYGKHFPVLFRAFDDWRPSAFIYFTVPFVRLFGLTIFAVRLPSVVLSLLSIIGIYFLTRECLYFLRDELAKRKTKDLMLAFSDSAICWCSLTASFLLAISPWHIYNSRFSNEPNLALTAVIFAVTFFLAFLRREKERHGDYFLIVSWVSFSLTFLAYNAEKLFIPFFVITILCLFKTVLLRHIKAMLISTVICFFLLLPTIYASVSGQTIVRLSTVSITSNSKLLENQSAMRLQHDPTSLGKIFDNRRFIFIQPFLVNYFSNFDPIWLFVGRDTTSYHLSEQGLFYLFSLPFFLLGIFILIKKNIMHTKVGWLFIFWILLAPLPSALTIEAPHINRTYQLLPPLILIEGIGLWYLVLLIKRVKPVFRYSLYCLLFVAGIFSLLKFFYSYFILFPLENSAFVQYGVQDALQYARTHEKEYDSIVVSNRENLRVSYMYYLFFSTYDPKTYQQHGGTKSGGLIEEHWIGKYSFVNPNTHPHQPKELYIINPGEIAPNGLHLLKKIYFLDGKEAIWIMAGN